MSKISKKQFERAKKIVKSYTRSFNRSNMPKFKCICCKTRAILPVKGYSLDTGHTKISEMKGEMWDGGTVKKISFGYGSNFDMKTYFIGICDDCMEKLINDKLAFDIRPIQIKEDNAGI